MAWLKSPASVKCCRRAGHTTPSKGRLNRPSITSRFSCPGRATASSLSANSVPSCRHCSSLRSARYESCESRLAERDHLVVQSVLTTGTRVLELDCDTPGPYRLSGVPFSMRTRRVVMLWHMIQYCTNASWSSRVGTYHFLRRLDLGQRLTRARKACPLRKRKRKARWHLEFNRALIV